MPVTGDVTENCLRKEQGQKPRRNYETIIVMKIISRIVWPLIYLLSVCSVCSQDNMKLEVTSFSRGNSAIYDIDVDFEEGKVTFCDLITEHKTQVKADIKKLTEFKPLLEDIEKMKSFKKNGVLGGKGLKMSVNGKVVYYNEHVKDVKQFSVFKALLKVLDAEEKARVLGSRVFWGES